MLLLWKVLRNQNMTNVRKVSSAIIIGLLVLGAFVSFFPSILKANPLEFLVQNQGTLSVTATTSVSYMTPGTATTTSTVYDTYANGAANTYATNNLALEIQFTASSTGSTLGWYYEYAQGNAAANCVSSPGSCDWYQDDNFTNVNATTTQTFPVTLTNKYTWLFASSSQGGGPILTTNQISNKIVTVQPVARYVRAVFFVPIGSTNVAVWSAFVGQKQSSN